MSLHFRRKKIPLPWQYEILQSASLPKSSGKLFSSHFVFQFTAQPTPISREYTVKIVLEKGKSPDVFVVSPSLGTLAEGRRIPHLYSQDPTRLCLYLPNSGEWDSGKLISKTIIPWTYLWLFYFEEWLATNEWKGGGVHPADLPNFRARQRKSRKKSRPLEGGAGGL